MIRYPRPSKITMAGICPAILQKMAATFLLIIFPHISYSQRYIKLFHDISIQELNYILDTCTQNPVVFQVHTATLSFKGEPGIREPFGKAGKSVEFFFIQHHHFITMENLLVLSAVSIEESDTTKKKASDHLVLAEGYRFTNCRFDEELQLFPNTKSIDISDCQFNKGFLGDLFMSHLSVNNSGFNSFESGFRGGNADFEDCVFNGYFSYYPFRSVWVHHPSWDSQEKPAGRILLRNSKIMPFSKSLDTLVSGKNLNLLQGVFSEIKMEDCDLGAPIKFKGECRESLVISSIGNLMCDFSELTFPADPFRIQIPVSKVTADPVVVYTAQNNGVFTKNKPSPQASQLQNNIMLASYRKLMDVYSKNGDDASYRKLEVFSNRTKRAITGKPKEKK